MYKIFADDTLIYDGTIEDYKIGKGEITLETNKSGSFVFSLYPDHFYYNKFVKLKTVITVYRSGRIVFRGRVLNDVTDYNNNKVFTCEGELGFLQDSIIRPFSFTGDPVYLFEKIINEHNAQVDEFKRFKIGSVTVVDPNEYIIRSNSAYETALSNINTSLVESSLGGYLYVTHGIDGTDPIPTINYFADFSKISPQTVEFGTNLKNYTKTVRSENIATAIIPLGATVDDGNENTEDKPLTITDVNNGVDYVYSEDGVALYGWIFKTVSWDDVTDANNLKRKAEAYVKDVVNQNITIELTVIDLHLLDPTIESFNLCDYIQAISSPHNFNMTLLCNKQTINLLKPDSDTLTLGRTYSSFTEATSKVSSALTSVTKVNSIVNSVTGKVNILDQLVKESTATTEERLETVNGTIEALAEVTVENSRNITSLVQETTTLGNQVSKNATKIEQTANGLSSAVQKGEVISEINQSAEQVRIKAEKIDFDGEMSLDGSFTSSADVFFEPGQYELDTIALCLKEGFWDTSKDITLYDRDGDGVITETDYQYFKNAMDGKISLADGWDKAVRSTVKITIEAANAQKTVRIQGVNMWGREIDTYIGANGISSASNINMHGGKIKNLSWDLDVENNDAISKYYADNHYSPVIMAKPKVIDHADHANSAGRYVFPVDGLSGNKGVPAEYESGVLECISINDHNHIHIIKTMDGKSAFRAGNNGGRGGTTWTWYKDWTDITYGIPKVGNELVSPVNIKAPNFIGRASTVHGLYDYVNNYGGKRPPSYVGANSVRFNMMNGFQGTTYDSLPFMDTLLMNCYSWSDAPYATAFGIQKTNGIPRAWIAAGENGDSWGGVTELITSNNIDDFTAKRALIGSPNNLLHSGNEFTYAQHGFSGEIWHNYRTANWEGNGNITGYIFGNGRGGTNGVTLHAENFNGKLQGEYFEMGAVYIPAYSTSGSNGYNYYGDVSVSHSFSKPFSDFPNIVLQVGTGTTGVVALEPISWTKSGIQTIRVHRASSANGVDGFYAYYVAAGG